MRFFKVNCKGGHVGRGHYRELTFYFEAKNLLEAMNKAKNMPGVKHSKPVLNACEIPEEKYRLMIKKSAYHR